MKLPIPLCIDATAYGSSAVVRMVRRMRECGALVLSDDDVVVVVVSQKALNDDPHLREARDALCDELCVLELQRTSSRGIAFGYKQWRTKSGLVA
jgi:hypothetical protein